MLHLVLKKAMSHLGTLTLFFSYRLSTQQSSNDFKKKGAKKRQSTHAQSLSGIYYLHADTAIRTVLLVVPNTNAHALEHIQL